jgi:hypothetical protein
LRYTTAKGGLWPGGRTRCCLFRTCGSSSEPCRRAPPLGGGWPGASVCPPPHLPRCAGAVVLLVYKYVYVSVCMYYVCAMYVQVYTCNCWWCVDPCRGFLVFNPCAKGCTISPQSCTSRYAASPLRAGHMISTPGAWFPDSTLQRVVRQQQTFKRVTVSLSGHKWVFVAENDVYVRLPSGTRVAVTIL